MTADPIAAMQAAEQKLLGMANGLGKFAIAVGARLTDAEQLALERLQLDDRVRLIDVSTIAEMPGHLFRVFMVIKT